MDKLLADFSSGNHPRQPPLLITVITTFDSFSSITSSIILFVPLSLFTHIYTSLSCLDDSCPGLTTVPFIPFMHPPSLHTGVLPSFLDLNFPMFPMT